MSGPVFREAMATHLCLPSPCCQSLVGKPTGYRGEVVDAFGDNVMSATMPFDMWRTRHNDIQMGIVALMKPESKLMPRYLVSSATLSLMLS